MTLSPFVLLGIAGLFFFLSPNLFLEPRFWAEEGSVFFQYAVEKPWYAALCAPHQGYYSFLINLATLLARFVPIDYAPCVTTYTAFIVQLIPYAVILWGRSRHWDNFFKKIISCSIVLHCPAYSGEIWLNTTNMHFHLAVVSFLILMEPVDEGMTRVRSLIYRGLLVVNGLTCVVSVFLLPVYIFAAYSEKRKERIVQTGILFACLLVQTAAFLYEWKVGDTAIRTPVVQDHWVRYLAGMYLLWGIQFPLGGWYAYLSKFAMALIIALTALTAFPPGGKRDDDRLMVVKTLGAYCVVMGLSLLTSSKLMGSPRYTYAPAVMLLFFYYFTMISARGFLLKSFAMLMLLVSGISGVGMYKFSMKRYNDYERWPHWHNEVQKWRADPKEGLMLWPQETKDAWKGHYRGRWQVRLDKQS